MMDQQTHWLCQGLFHLPEKLSDLYDNSADQASSNEHQENDPVEEVDWRESKENI